MLSTTGRVSIIWYEKGNSRKIYTIRLRYPHCRIVEFVMLSSCMTVRPQLKCTQRFLSCCALVVHSPWCVGWAGILNSVWFAEPKLELVLVATNTANPTTFDTWYRWCVVLELYIEFFKLRLTIYVDLWQAAKKRSLSIRLRRDSVSLIAF